MNFIDPSLEEVFQTLVNNDHIIDFLKEKKILITKKDLKKYYQKEEIDSISQYIYFNNVETLYSVAEVLLKNKDIIKSNSITYLVSKKIAWDDISEALRVPILAEDVYRNIVFTYKYCYVSSFFQNNKEMFIPENDFFEMENNPAAMAFYDAVMKEFDKLDDILSKTSIYMDSDKIPWDVMTYLTQLLGFEKSTFKLDNEESKFREIAKNILDIYRIKGTDYSFKVFFNFLGFDIDIHEYYFDRRMFYLNDAGNLETDTSNRGTYLYYLTSNNPSENTLNNISTNEIVYPSDITEQYSLEEFDYLVEKYGIEAVLGYSLSDKYGNEYTDKVYKYFKSNHVYYEIYPMDGNLTAEKVATINRCLEFLTPSYILRRATKSEAKTSETDDSISFDGDGSKIPNEKTGNFNDGIEILDDEDWDNFDQESYIEKDPVSDYFVWKGSKKRYYNSLYSGEKNTDPNKKRYLEDNKFRIPIRTRWANRSLNRYLTGALKTPYITNKILKNYIHDKKHYISHEDFFEGKNTIYQERDKEISLVGKNSIKEYIKNNDIPTEIKIVDNLNNLKTLNYYPSANRTLIKIKDFNNMEEVDGFPISNKGEEYPLEKDLKTYFLESNKDICQKLVYGKYCICKKSNNSYSLYRYGNYNYNYRTIEEKEGYLNSFNYKLEPIKGLDFSGREGTFVADYLKVESRATKKDIEDLIKITKEEISSGIKDMDYISDTIYYVSSEKKYYNAIKIPNLDACLFDNSFNSLEEANKEENKYLNKEAKIGDNLYCCKYSNIQVGELLYNKDDNQLYYVDDLFNIVKYNDFFGKIKIESDQNGKEICKLYIYDKSWKGYDEQADNEDFILYNAEHKITWPKMGFYNKIIGRPIENQTNNEYKTKLLFEILLDEFCSVTCNNFIDDEKLKILNIISKSFESIITDHNIFENYSLNDLLKDYYKIILNNNYNLNNFSDNFKNDYKPLGDDGNYTESQKLEIKKCFDNAKELIEKYNNELVVYNGRKDLEKEDPQYEGEYYSVYSEFKTLLDIYVSKNDVDNFFQFYYYNKLVHLYREKFIEDDDTYFDVNDSRRTLITPAAYVEYNSLSGNYLFPHILESSYKVGSDGKDISIRVPFYKVSKENNYLKLYTNKQSIYDAFGYLPSKEDFKNRILKPVFIVNDKSFYDGLELTSWQKSKHNFNKFYSTNEIIEIANNEIIIKITDNKLLGYDFNESELNNVEGYIEVNNIEGSFIDSNISYPASYKDTEKDYNGVPSEFVSFGSDRDYEYDIKYGKEIKAKAFINKDKKIILKVKDTDIKFNSKIKQIVLEEKLKTDYSELGEYVSLFEPGTYDLIVDCSNITYNNFVGNKTSASQFGQKLQKAKDGVLLNLILINTPLIVDSSYMLKDCICIKTINTSVFSKLTKATGMFEGCTNITSVDVSNHSYLKDSSNMFEGCSSLTNINWGNISPDKYDNMFLNATSLKNIDVIYPETKEWINTNANTMSLKDYTVNTLFIYKKYDELSNFIPTLNVGEHYLIIDCIDSPSELAGKDLGEGKYEISNLGKELQKSKDGVVFNLIIKIPYVTESLDYCLADANNIKSIRFSELRREFIFTKDLNYEGSPDPISIKLKEETPLDYSESPIRKGYYFTEWTSDIEGTIEAPKLMESKDTTIYAQWVNEYLKYNELDKELSKLEPGTYDLTIDCAGVNETELVGKDLGGGKYEMSNLGKKLNSVKNVNFNLIVNISSNITSLDYCLIGVNNIKSIKFIEK